MKREYWHILSSVALLLVVAILSVTVLSSIRETVKSEPLPPFEIANTNVPAFLITIIGENGRKMTIGYITVGERKVPVIPYLD
jgi:hypothetical protein